MGEEQKIVPNSSGSEQGQSETALLWQMLAERSRELQEKNQNLVALTNNIPGGVICCSTDDRLKLLEVSEGFLTMFGYTRKELREKFGDSYFLMIHPEDRQPVLDSVRRQLEHGTTIELEYRVIRGSGEDIWVLERGQLVRQEDGAQVFYCVVVDITTSKVFQEELRLSLERYQIIMDQTTDIIFEWNMAADTLQLSSNWEKKFGYIPITRQVSQRLLGESHIHPEDRGSFEKLVQEMKSGLAYSVCELRIMDREGHYRWYRIRSTLQWDEQGHPARAVGVILDIDSERRKTQRLVEQAQRDTLTGLYNRGTTETLIEELLNEEGGGKASGALFVLDVDEFKQINDRYGHLGGDVILSNMAGILQRLFRNGDIIGRIGGDEFAVFLRNVPQGEAVEQKARVLLENLSKVGGQEMAASCSLGIAYAPAHGRTFRALYQSADAALYHAKLQGKDTFAVFEPQYGVPEPEQLKLLGTTGAGIESEQRTGLMSSRLAEYIFGVLYQSDDVERAVLSILGIVGKQIDVSRVYIFEFSEDDSYCINTFEWCDDGIEPQKSTLQHLSASEVGDLKANFGTDGVFYCRDIEELLPAQREVLRRQNICSVLQCALYDENAIWGFLGFDECRGNRLWTQEQVDVLTLIAKILGMFLLQKRIKDKMARNLQAAEEVLDQREEPTCILDLQEGRVLYANRAALSQVPGLKCGEIFLGTWDQAQARPMRWQGKREALLLVWQE